MAKAVIATRAVEDPQRYSCDRPEPRNSCAQANPQDSAKAVIAAPERPQCDSRDVIPAVPKKPHCDSRNENSAAAQKPQCNPRNKELSKMRSSFKMQITSG